MPAPAAGRVEVLLGSDGQRRGEHLERDEPNEIRAVPRNLVVEVVLRWPVLQLVQRLTLL